MSDDESRRVDATTWLLVYIIVLYAIPSRLVIDQLGSAGAPSMLFGLALFGGWALYQLIRPADDLQDIQRRPVRIALTILLLCVGISYALAMSRPIEVDEVSPADVALLSLLSWSGVLLTANDGIPTLARLRTFIGYLTWAGTIMAILGLAQFVTGDAFVDRISIPGLRDAEFAVFQRDGFIRPSGTATHPIEFGLILTMLLPFALHTAYHGRSRNIVLRWTPVLLNGIAIALTFSRSAYLSVFVALAVLVLGWPATRRRGFLVGALVLAAGLFSAVPRLFGTIGSLFRNVGNDPSIASRTDSYDLFWEFFVLQPIFGRGLGTFLTKYRIFDNQYLMLLIGLGIVGTLAFAMLLLVGIGVALRVWRLPRPTSSDLGLAGAASLAAGAVGLSTFDGFAFPMTMGTMFLILGLMGALHRLTTQRQTLTAPLSDDLAPRPLVKLGRRRVRPVRAASLPG